MVGSPGWHPTPNRALGTSTPLPPQVTLVGSWGPCHLAVGRGQALLFGHEETDPWPALLWSSHWPAEVWGVLLVCTLPFCYAEYPPQTTMAPNGPRRRRGHSRHLRADSSCGHGPRVPHEPPLRAPQQGSGRLRMTWILERTKRGPSSGPLSCCPAGGHQGLSPLAPAGPRSPVTSQSMPWPLPQGAQVWSQCCSTSRLRVLSCKEHLPSQGTYGGGGGSQLACAVSGLSWDTMWAGTVHLAPASLCQAWRGAPGAGSVLGTMVVGTGAQGPGTEHLDVGAPTGPRALPGLEVILWNPLPPAATPALRPPPFRPGGGPAQTPPRVPPPDAGPRPAGGAAGPAPAAALPGPRGGAEGRVGAAVTAQEGGAPRAGHAVAGTPSPQH